jgi:phosphohistidine swiveling domain-containing protein
MMDTILNVGLNKKTYPYWLKKLPPACAEGSYLRFLEMFGEICLDIPREKFQGLGVKEREGLCGDSAMLAPEQQVALAILAVWKSWDSPRAKVYRELNNIPHSLGTAVTVQAMVFGNMNDNSGTGVVFSRNPMTGEPHLKGEYMVNAQGEDIVAGIRTPQPIACLLSLNNVLAEELNTQVKALERHYKDMQDIEFTVQSGELYILQARSGKRTDQAALRIALDMVSEGILKQEEVKTILTYRQYLGSCRPCLDPAFSIPPTLVGIPASPGIASGAVVFSSKKAEKAKTPVILVSHETTPNDIAGMAVASGVVTAIGGMTSHAAVVARGMNLPAVVGCTGLALLSGANPIWMLGGKVLQEGDLLSLDGSTGNIWLGVEAPTTKASDKERLEFQAMAFPEGFNAYHEEVPPEGSTGLMHIDTVLRRGDSPKFKSLLGFKGVLDVRPRCSLFPPLLGKVGGSLMDADYLADGEMSLIAELMNDPHVDSSVKVLCSPFVAKLQLHDGVAMRILPEHQSPLDLIELTGGVFYTGESSSSVQSLLALKVKAGEELSLLQIGRGGVGMPYMTTAQAVRSFLGG